MGRLLRKSPPPRRLHPAAPTPAESAPKQRWGRRRIPHLLLRKERPLVVAILTCARRRCEPPFALGRPGDERWRMRWPRRLRREARPQIPNPWIARVEIKQRPAWGSPSRGKATPALDT